MVKVNVGDRMIVRLHKVNYSGEYEHKWDVIAEHIVEEVSDLAVKVREVSYTKEYTHPSVWFEKSSLDKDLIDVISPETGK